jgi:hypothetical protein
MPRIEKKRHACGHRGYGETCHRCDQAFVIEQEIAIVEKTVTTKPKAVHKGRDGKEIALATYLKDTLKPAAARLRSVPAPRSTSPVARPEALRPNFPTQPSLAGLSTVVEDMATEAEKRNRALLESFRTI